MDINELTKHKVEDKTKILEAQKETVESFKQFFGDYEAIFETADELDKKFNDFLQWRNKEWIVPGKGKTPEQLWKEAGNPPIELPRMDLKKNFDEEMEKFGIIADPIFGIVFVPFYGYLKEFFEGDYKKVPDYWEFFEHIIVAEGNIPSFVIRNIILKNKEKTIELFKHKYKNVKNLEDIFKILEKSRKDWNDASELWQEVINSEKTGTINASNQISEEELKEFEISTREFDSAWQEYFKDKPEPKDEKEDRKQQEEFNYWYNNVRKQTDTGKTPLEMDKRIMNFEFDEDYSEDFEELDNCKERSPGILPREVFLIEKILLLTKLSFNNEEQKAIDKYKEMCSEEIQAMASEIDFHRGFQSWFLLEYKLPNGKTPFEMVFSREDLDKLFSKREIKMIENFLAFKQSLFEIKNISKNKKDYTLINVTDNQKYFVKTIDFPAKLKIGDFIITCLVQKLDKTYFFYGNVLTYGKSEGLRLKKTFLEEYKKLQNEQSPGKK